MAWYKGTPVEPPSPSSYPTCLYVNAAYSEDRSTYPAVHVYHAYCDEGDRELSGENFAYVLLHVGSLHAGDGDLTSRKARLCSLRTPKDAPPHYTRRSSYHPHRSVSSARRMLPLSIMTLSSAATRGSAALRRFWPRGRSRSLAYVFECHHTSNTVSLSTRNSHLSSRSTSSQ